MTILSADRHIQPQRMSKLLQVFGARTFAEHLLHGVARNNVREKKHESDDEPKRRKRKQ